MIKKLVMPLVLVSLVLVISGCTSSYSAEDIKNTNPDEISKETALKMCYYRAEGCSEGIPAVEDAFKQACYELYYYTGNSSEIWAFAEDMC